MNTFFETRVKSLFLLAILTFCTATGTSPALAGSHDPVAKVERLAERADVIQLAYRGHQVASLIYHNQSRTLLARYGGYTRFEGDRKDESYLMISAGNNSSSEIADMRRSLARITGLTPDEQTAFDTVFANLERLQSATRLIKAALDEMDIDAANQIYLAQTEPAYNQVVRVVNTLISNNSRLIDEEIRKSN